MAQCSLCHQSIPAGAYPFTLRLELFPAIEPSLEITQADLEVDFEAEMKRLIELMEKMDEQQVIEQEKLMFISHAFTLCRPCRDRLAAQLDRLGPPTS